MHLQVPGCTITANFGTRQFAFPPAEMIAEDGTEDEDSGPFSRSKPRSLRSMRSEPTTPIGAVDAPRPAPQLYSLPCGESMSGIPRVTVGEEAIETDQEEELLDKLIVAWQKNVFPVLSQRFRNSSDRAQGVAQIEGALRGKQFDLADMLVNMLYDDSGGRRPPDLHLPTMDDIKAAAQNMDANELKPGVRVLIRAKDGRTSFEASGMASTRGLVGEVVRTNVPKSAALVEVYIPGEALLTQWWFPFSVLEHADKAVGRACTDDEAHDRLLMSQSELTRLCCRNAVLQLQQHGLLQNTGLTDFYTLRLLACQFQRIELPGQCQIRSAKASEFFEFSQNGQKRWTSFLKQMIEKAAMAGEDAVIQLVKKVCWCLGAEKAAERHMITIGVVKGRKGFNIRFPEASSSVVVSVRSDRGEFSAPKSVDEPWLRIYAGSNAAGPRTAVLPCVDAGPSKEPYLLLQSSELHLRTTSQGSPSTAVVLHEIPSTWQTALAFVQGPMLESSSIPSKALDLVGRAMSSTLAKCSLPPCMVEIFCHTLAAIVRKLQPADDKANPLSECITEQAQTLELFTTYWKSPTLSSARLPTRLQAVLELVLAGIEVPGAAVLSSGSLGGRTGSGDFRRHRLRRCQRRQTPSSGTAEV